MTKGKKEKLYIFFIVILSVLLAGVLILTITGVFYKGNNNKQPTMLNIGQSSVIALNGTEVKTLAFNFDGAFLSGEFLKQNISIKNISEKDLFIRANLTIFTGENDDPVLKLVTSEGWKLQEDGKYLYEGYVSSINTIGLCSGFIVSPEKQLKSSTAYIIVISVEGLSTEFDRMAVWGY